MKLPGILPVIIHTWTVVISDRKPRQRFRSSIAKWAKHGDRVTTDSELCDILKCNIMKRELNEHRCNSNRNRHIPLWLPSNRSTWQFHWQTQLCVTWKNIFLGNIWLRQWSKQSYIAIKRKCITLINPNEEKNIHCVRVLNMAVISGNSGVSSEDVFLGSIHKLRTSSVNRLYHMLQ